MLNHMLFGEPIGQSWLQLSELALAFVLSALIGLEREIRQKSAGLRTYMLVGVSSALIMLVSKYGFTDRRTRERPRRPRPFARRRPDCFGNWVHWRRRYLRPERPCARAHNSVDRLAHSRNRHGGGRRPPDPGHHCDLRPFHRGIHLSSDRAQFTQVALGAFVPSHFL